jgi:hypothetical protein
MADCIVCGTATPNPLHAGSSQHHGRRRQRLVLSESTVGASNWGGSADVTKKRFFLHTTINWAMADCIACGTATPNPLHAASSQHHGQRCQRSVLSESTVGASNWGGSADVTKKRFFHTRQSTGLWLIASSVVLPPPTRFVPVHPNTMDNPPLVCFCLN